MKRKKGWFKKHVTAIICIVAVVLLMIGSLSWYAATTYAYVQQTNAKTAQMAKDAAEIAKQAEARQAEEAAKKAAEEQAQKQAAAEQAKTGSSVATVDPKTCNDSTTHTNPASIDVVVNKQHCIQPLNYTPADLQTSHGATLSAQAMTAFNQMYDAAVAAGQPFSVTSSYRSYTTQISTYNHWVATSGKTAADTYSARPGYSEHQTGFAMDVAAGSCTLDCFGTTSQYQWFQQNAAKYGFIQRYYAGYESITGYKAEEWHYRYVGVTVAQDMKARGIKTLEQYWGISGGDY